MFGGCISEAVVELPVYVSLDGGDLFLLGGFWAKGCSKWFELEGGFIRHILCSGYNKGIRSPDWIGACFFRLHCQNQCVW